MLQSGLSMFPRELSGSSPPWQGITSRLQSLGFSVGPFALGKVHAGPALDSDTAWPGVGRRERRCKKKASSPALLFKCTKAKAKRRAECLLGRHKGPSGRQQHGQPREQKPHYTSDASN